MRGAFCYTSADHVYHTQALRCDRVELDMGACTFMDIHRAFPAHYDVFRRRVEINGRYDRKYYLLLYGDCVRLLHSCSAWR